VTKKGDEMEYVVIVGTSLASVTLFVLPGVFKTRFSLFIHIILAISGFSLGTRVLTAGSSVILYSGFAGLPVMTIDNLSALFLIMISLSALVIPVYVLKSLGFYGVYEGERASVVLFAMTWLHISLIFLCSYFSGINFLFVWELMSISSFVIVFMAGGRRESRAVAFTYIVQMQLVFVLVRFAFLFFQSPMFLGDEVLGKEIGRVEIQY
jgi:formate hydrogenlyase subunit 3/multisubunit Na+/H+ antiporter MnhD subunit